MQEGLCLAFPHRDLTPLHSVKNSLRLSAQKETQQALLPNIDVANWKLRVQSKGIKTTFPQWIHCSLSGSYLCLGAPETPAGWLPS